MPYEIINEIFLLKNINNPGRIIDRINNPELVVYQKSQSNVLNECIDIVENTPDIQDAERLLTECIRNYHTTLYTK